MDFLKRAGEYFKNHISVHRFHFTSDGMAFQGKSDAEAHARTLTDSEVKTIVRADVEVADEVVSGGVTSTSLSDQTSLSEQNPEDKPTTKVKAGKK